VKEKERVGEDRERGKRGSKRRERERKESEREIGCNF